MKNKKIYGFVLLALIIMLLPIGMVSAKYKQTINIGTVTLDIAPPILSPNWYTQVSENATISELIVDSFTPETEPNRYNFFSWGDGKPVGYNSKDNNKPKNNVRLFERDKDDGTKIAYILAIGKNPVIFPEDSSYLFAGWRRTHVTEKITFYNIDTSTVNNMQWMFHFCESLTSLDISSFNTSHVTNMNHMFAACSSMTGLTLGANFKTSNVTNMANMFNGCEVLADLRLSDFDTSRVTNMDHMFHSCKILKELDLSKFNTSQVNNMRSMFHGCSNLKTICVGDGWNTGNLSTPESYQNMFLDCTSLVGGNGTKYNSSHIGKDYAKIDGDKSEPGYLTRKQTSTSINTFSLVQEGGTITSTKTTGN